MASQNQVQGQVGERYHTTLVPSTTENKKISAGICLNMPTTQSACDMNSPPKHGTATQQLEARHHVSGLNSRFNGNQLEFSDYVLLNRKMIAQARSGLTSANQEKIIEGNAPFEFNPTGNYSKGRTKPYQRGVLLIHGLTDSPYFMRPLGRFFQENGFRVMAVLLPGHGTQPGDLLDVRWQEWAKTVAYGADKLVTEVDELYLAGFSAGGVLSVYQALCDQRVRGLFLFSPAFSISPKAARAHLHKPFSWLFPTAKWVGIMPDRDLYKYESFPKNAASQMHALTREINEQELLHKLNLPIFTAVSADDTTAETSSTLNFMMRIPHASSKLVLYAADKGEHALGFPEEKLELVNSVAPEHRILSASHTSIMLPPDDKHYGMKGEYSNCTHYFPNEMEKYNECINHPDKVLQGEITPQNLAVGTMRRLMFNPNFDKLTRSIRKFIEKL